MLRGAHRSDIAATVSKAGGGGDASGNRPNWTTIAVSPVVQYNMTAVIFPCSASISLDSETEHDIFMGSKYVAPLYHMYSVTKCGYLVIIFWFKSRLLVEISAHVLMWNRKDILFPSYFPKCSLLPATVAVQPKWLTAADVEVTQAREMEELLARLAPKHPRLPPETPRIDRVSVPQASLAPLSLFHLPMVSLVETIEPHQDISALTTVDLANSILSQRQGISTILVPPPPAAPE